MSAYMSVADRNKCIFYIAAVARGDVYIPLKCLEKVGISRGIWSWLESGHPKEQHHWAWLNIDIYNVCLMF